MPLRIVKPVHMIAGPARSREVTKPIVAAGSGAMSDDFEAIVAKFFTGLQQDVGPAKQLRQLTQSQLWLAKSGGAPKNSDVPPVREVRARMAEEGGWGYCKLQSLL